MTDFEDVLMFWFGELDADGRADAAHMQAWFKKDPAFDRTLGERFGAVHEGVATGACEGWLESRRGRLAYVVVLDQLSRNLFRGSAKMFAHDARALEVARDGIARGADRGLAYAERGFIYMPFMHSEKLADQERSVELFMSWRDELAGPLRDALAESLKYAELHRDIVRRFGRFPHRNALYGRPSSAEELEFLKRPGSSF